MVAIFYFQGGCHVKTYRISTNISASSHLRSQSWCVNIHFHGQGILSSRKWFPSSLMTWARLTACSVKLLCVEDPSSWWCPSLSLFLMGGRPLQSPSVTLLVQALRPSISWRMMDSQSDQLHPQNPWPFKYFVYELGWLEWSRICWWFCGWPSDCAPRTPWEWMLVDSLCLGSALESTVHNSGGWERRTMEVRLSGCQHHHRFMADFHC